MQITPSSHLIAALSALTKPHKATHDTASRPAAASNPPQPASEQAAPDRRLSPIGRHIDIRV